MTDIEEDPDHIPMIINVEIQGDQDIKGIGQDLDHGRETMKTTEKVIWKF